MMKLIVFARTVLIFCFLSVTVNAEVLQKQVLSFSEVGDLVSDIDIPEQTLLVVDFQDTLVTLVCDSNETEKQTCPYIGSVAWLKWQNSLIETEPNSEYLVATDRLSLLNISSIILSQTQLTYSENSIPKVLEDFRSKGGRIMFVSQYDRHQRLPELTSVRLSLNEKTGTNLGDLLVENAPKIEESHKTVAACNQSTESNISYQNGVLYTSGQDKSLVLSCFLELYKKQLETQKNKQANDDGLVPSSTKAVSKLIYVDDSSRELDSLSKVYLEREDYDVFSVHYVALKEHLDNLLADEKETALQEQAHKKWLEMKSDVLSQIFQ